MSLTWVWSVDGELSGCNLESCSALAEGFTVTKSVQSNQEVRKHLFWLTFCKVTLALKPAFSSQSFFQAVTVKDGRLHPSRSVVSKELSLLTRRRAVSVITVTSFCSWYHECIVANDAAKISSDQFGNDFTGCKYTENATRLSSIFHHAFMTSRWCKAD